MEKSIKNCTNNMSFGVQIPHMQGRSMLRPYQPPYLGQVIFDIMCVLFRVSISQGVGSGNKPTLRGTKS